MSAAPLIQEEVERRTTTTPVRRSPARKPERVPKSKPKARKRRKAVVKSKSRQRTDAIGVACFVMFGVCTYLMSGLVGYSSVERAKQSLDRMQRQASEARYDLQRRESLAFLSSAPARLGENARREGFTSPEIQEEDRRSEEAQTQLAANSNPGAAGENG